MYRDMVARISEKIQSGATIEEIKPGDILDMDASKLAKIEAKFVNRGQVTEGVDIRFAYVESREHYMKRAAGATEQWVDEDSAHVILTLAGKAYRDRSDDAAKHASYQHSINLHHAFDAAFAVVDKLALVTVNTGSDCPDPVYFTGGREDVIEVVLPRSYSDEAIVTDTQLYRMANNLWRDVPAGASTYTHDGVDIAAAYVVDGVSFVRVLAIPDGMFSEAGMLGAIEGDLANAIDSWANGLARFAANPGEIVAVVDETEPTAEEIQQYEGAKLMISMSKASVAQNTERIKTTERKVREHNSNVEALMSDIVAQKRRHMERLTELKTLTRERDAGLVGATGSMLAEYESIVADDPVKSAVLSDRNGDTIMTIELHPLVADAEEQAMDDNGDWPRERGKPSLRVFDRIKFEMNLSSGTTRVGDIIKWLHPTDVKAGFDKRCHPHNYTDGRSCWGQLGEPFAEAVAEMRWHDALQWVYNYCANVRDDEPHHTQQWNFKPAPAGMMQGWILPGTAEYEQLAEWDPETPLVPWDD